MLSKQEVILIPYPAWGVKNTILELFGIGRNQLEEFRSKGWVLTRKVGNSVQYRCKDVDATMECQAKGLKPRRAR